jgi:hypothetical protein
VIGDYEIHRSESDGQTIIEARVLGRTFAGTECDGFGEEDLRLYISNYLSDPKALMRFFAVPEQRDLVVSDGEVKAVRAVPPSDVAEVIGHFHGLAELANRLLDGDQLTETLVALLAARRRVFSAMGTDRWG